MKNLLKHMFSRPSAQGVVSDGSVEGAQVALYDEQATTQLVRMLSYVPDMDEVLRQAGVRRDKLRVLLYDDEIAQACETRLDALLAVPMRIEPSEGPQAQLLNDLITPVLRDAVTAAFQARLFGYSVMEAVYEPRPDGKVGLKYLGEKPMEWFSPRSDGTLRFFPDDGSGGGEGIEVDQRYKFFLTRSRPTYRHPQGEALLSRLYWPWFFRTNGWKFWAKFLERFGSPLLVGKSTNTKGIAQALLMAHTQAVMGVDRDDSVEAIGTPGGATGQAFDSFEAALLRRIQKVILGQTLTSGTDAGSGNRALGQVHDAVRMDKRDSDIQLVQGTVQRVVDALCELNQLDRHTVVFADETGLEVNRALRDKDLYSVGVRFSKDYFQDNYSLRAEDFEVTKEEEPSLPTMEASMGGTVSRGPNHFSKLPPQRFTKQQQMVEDAGDKAIDQAGSPFESEFRQAVLAASSPEDLESRLFALIGDQVSREDFRDVVAKALYTADVLGYVHNEGKV